MKLIMIGSKAMELKELIEEQKTYNKLTDTNAMWELLKQNIPIKYQREVGIVDFTEDAIELTLDDKIHTRLQLLKHALRIKKDEDYRKQFYEEFSNFLDTIRCFEWATTSVGTFISCIKRCREETQEIGPDICEEAINGARQYAEDAIFDTLSNLAETAENLGIKIDERE